jgi:hypothetical protein
MTELLHSTICGLLCSAAPHTPIGGGGGADGALQLLHLALLHLSQVEQNACTRNAYATPRRASASNHPPGQRVRMTDIRQRRAHHAVILWRCVRRRPATHVATHKLGARCLPRRDIVSA